MKLLSPKRFNEFNPDEYYSYVKSLNKPKEVKVRKPAKPRKKKEPKKTSLIEL